jgi:O-antigen/teichoic acid export membrane protein
LMLGREDVGLYAQAYAFLSLLNLLALSGLRAGLTRFVAVHFADADPGGVRGTVRLGMALTALGSTVLGGTLFAIAPQVAAAFDDDRLVTGLRFVALTLPAMTLTDAALSATQGWRTMRPYALIGNVFEPLARLALTALLLFLGAGLDGAFAALVSSNWAALVLAMVALVRRVRRTAGAPIRYRPRELFGFSVVSWLASLASTGLIWASTLQLGLLRDSGDVGIYNVATRLVALAVFVMPPINHAFSPHIAYLHHRRRDDELRQTYGVATSWIIRLSLPAFVTLVVFPEQLLRLFGAEFVAGATVTMILALGKLVDASTGPCGLMLNMSGRAVLSMVDNVAVLLLNVALNAWLIPTHGITGAAVAWAVCLWLVNCARVLQVWWLMRMLPFDVGVLKGLAAGIVALATALLMRVTLGGPPEAAVGIPAMLTAYVGVLLALGLTVEDRMVLQMLGRRLRLRPA